MKLFFLDDDTVLVIDCFEEIIKTYAIHVVTTSKKKEAFTEFMGRIMGWFSLFFNPPK